jgi:hypothetical protein
VTVVINKHPSLQVHYFTAVIYRYLSGFGLYRLSGTIELDDAFIGGKHKDKRGRGAQGKTPVLIACQTVKRKQDLLQ